VAGFRLGSHWPVGCRTPSLRSHKGPLIAAQPPASAFTGACPAAVASACLCTHASAKGAAAAVRGQEKCRVESVKAASTRRLGTVSGNEPGVRRRQPALSVRPGKRGGLVAPLTHAPKRRGPVQDNGEGLEFAQRMNELDDMTNPSVSSSFVKTRSRRGCCSSPTIQRLVGKDRLPCPLAHRRPGEASVKMRLVKDVIRRARTVSAPVKRKGRVPQQA